MKTNNTRSARGFTLIELMIVVAIIGILAALAIPAYLNYVTRAQVSEGLTLAGGVKTAIAEYYASTGRMPDSLEDVALEEPSGKYVESISVDGGLISIVYGGQASDDIMDPQHNTLVLAPGLQEDGGILWQCGHADQPAGEGVKWEADADEITTVEPRFLPVSCRG